MFFAIKASHLHSGRALSNKDKQNYDGPSLTLYKGDWCSGDAGPKVACDVKCHNYDKSYPYFMVRS